MEFTATKSSAWSKSPGPRKTAAISGVAKIILALAARRENQNALAQRLFRELSEQYPHSELFTSEYAKAMSVASGD